MSDLVGILIGGLVFCLFTAGFFCVAHGLEGLGFLLMVAAVSVAVLLFKAIFEDD